MNDYRNRPPVDEPRVMTIGLSLILSILCGWIAVGLFAGALYALFEAIR